MSVPGHLVGVTEDRFGGVLTADLTIGDTVVHVDSTIFFDEEQGGQLLIGGVHLAYEPFDDGDEDADTDGPTEIPLTAPSTVAADEGDPVWAFDPTTGADDPVAELVALVTIDDRDDGNAVPARIRAGLAAQLDSDFETYLGKAVELDVIDGELVLVDILGSKHTGALKFDQDQTTAVGAGGTVTLDLKYIPVENSEHLYVGGVYQRGAVWTRDRWTVTIPDEEARLRADIKVAMEYAYTDPATKPPVVYSPPVSHARSGTWGAYPSASITSQALPSGTQIGDLLVAVAIGDGGSGATISDPRMTAIISSGGTTIAIGYATDLTDMICDVGGTAFTLDQFAGIEVLAVHGDGSGPLAYDPARIAIYGGPAGAAIGSVSGAGHGVIAAITAAYGNPISIDMATHMPAYTDWGGEQGTAVLGNFGYCATEPPPAQTTPANANTSVVLIGIK